MMKKISAVLLAVMMLLSMSFAVAAANEGTLTLVWDPASVYYVEGEDNLFTVDVKVEGPETVAMHDLVLAYDDEVVQLVDAEGDAVSDYPEDAVTTFDRAFALDMCTFLENGDLSILGIKKGQGSIDMPADGILFTLTFKAIAAGDSAMTATSLYTAVNGGEAWTITDKTAADAVVVKAKPVAPTASSFAVDGTVADGETVEADYAFDNGERTPGADTTAGDVSEVKWYVEGIEAAVATGKTLAISDDAWVGKKLSYTVLPKTDVRAIDAEGALSEAFDCGYILPAEGYAPVISAVAVEGGKVSAAAAAKAVATFEKTYANAEYAVAYKWFLEGAADPVVGETATFGADAIDKTVVVKAIVTISVGGEAFAASEEVASDSYTITSEPPTLTIAETVPSKKPYAGASFALSAANVSAVSNAEGDTAVPTIAYAWYIVDEFVAAEEFSAEGKEVLDSDNSFAVPKETEGKFVVVVITATDALDISTTKTVAFTNAIAKLPSGGGSVGGASLSDDKKEEEPKEEEPKEEPKEDNDPAGEAIENGAAAFTDVNKETYAWAYDGIDALAKAGVIKGMTATTFGPEEKTTNAQVVALAVRIAGLKAKDGATTDIVAKDHWVQAEMAAAAEANILGVFGDKVDVEAATTREVAFTLLYNALKAAGVELAETAEAIEYTDAASIDAACVEAITALTKAGIVNGMGDGTLAPKATITRAQLAKILGIANSIIAK